VSRTVPGTADGDGAIDTSAVERPLGEATRWPPPVRLSAMTAATRPVAARTTSQRPEGKRKSFLGPWLISSNRHTCSAQTTTSPCHYPAAWPELGARTTYSLGHARALALTPPAEGNGASNSSDRRPSAATGDSAYARTIRANWGYARLKTDGRATAPLHRQSGLRTTGACPRDAPRTTINSQRSPPAATCEHEASAGYQPASNAREHPRNA
jgi:hypothetical protein